MIIKNKIPSHYCEVSYLNLLEIELSKELDDRYSLYIIHSDLNEFSFREKIESDFGYKIAIHIGNENFFDSKYYEFFDLIFRFYLEDRCDYEKIFPINIGFNSSGKFGIYPKKGKKLSDRKTDVFFIGNKEVRMDFYRAASKLSQKYEVSFTEGFRRGISIEEYYEKISDSKICLVPSGCSPETFRYSESYGSGCIVITKNKIKSWFYESSPAFFVKDWSEITEKYIDDILESNIDNMYLNNLDYFEKKLSPKANSEYNVKNIKKRLQC